MIITMLDRNTPTKPLPLDMIQPDYRGLFVSGDSLKLTGDSLRAITISTDGGYRFEQMATGVDYSGGAILKSQLQSMKGYTLTVGGNAKIAGNHSDFPIMTINGVVDVENMVLDRPVVNDLFNGADIAKTPILYDMPYDFSRTFYNNLDLDFIDFTMIKESNLTQCVFTEFAPTTTEIRFADDVDKEVQQYILSQRHKV